MGLQVSLRDVLSGSEFLLVDALAAKGAHAGTLVQPQGTGQAVAVDKQLDRAATAPVELPEREAGHAVAVPRLPTTTRPG